MKVVFSIVTVSLNSGGKLLETMKSIEKQTLPATDYEVIVKDGGSKDTSLEMLEDYLKEHPAFAARVKVVREKDSSIYEGMNQAILHTGGEYLIFMNCGDNLYEEDTLEKVASEIEKLPRKERKTIFYGNLWDALRGQEIMPNPHLDAFGCYRNIPCHQSCIYHRELFAERRYRPEFEIRADYEHFLWCFFKKKIRPRYIEVLVASYEGGGYSETKENRIKSKEEHKKITREYMTWGQRKKYQIIMMLTLAPLRIRMAESRHMAGIYQTLKKWIYRK